MRKKIRRRKNTIERTANTNVRRDKTSCKSKLEFHVADGSDQVETQSKAFAAISVTLTQNAKDFQPADNVLNQNAFS
jgi:hypothetical protein